MLTLRIPFFLIAGFLLLGLSLQQAWAQEVVDLQTIEEFDHQGKPVPLAKASTELLSYIEKNLNISFNVKRVPWKRAMDNALQRDIVLMGMSKTTERAKKYAFSEPINANGNWLITRCDATFTFDSLQDLQGKLVGIVSGTSAGEAFDLQMNKMFRIENDIGAGISRLKKLMAKRVDALVWYGITSDVKEMQFILNRNYAIQHFNNDTGSATPFCVLPKPVSIVTNHFAMRINPDNQKLLDRINQALNKGRKEGAITPLRATNLD
ncbi:substrate-binding periplasmic protein [Undibacterium sp.]|uniref:substrate-binding periplasmic protein n=1 Tax=Undibacterium sp. TaxID=1914977 RepID=UPI0037513549